VRVPTPGVSSCSEPHNRTVPDLLTRANLPASCPATTTHRTTSTALTHEPRTVRLRASPDDANTEPHRAGFVLRAGSSCLRTVPDRPTRANLPAPCPATTTHRAISTAPTHEPRTVLRSTGTGHPPPHRTRTAGRDPGLQADRTDHAPVATSPGPDSVGT